MRPTKPSRLHKWVSTRYVTDFNGNVLEDIGYWYSGPWALAHDVPSYDQDSFRWRDDDDSETAAAWLELVNVDHEFDLSSGDVDARLRFLIQEFAGFGISNLDIEITFQIDGGGYNQVGAATTGCIYYDSSNLTQDDNTTQQLGSGTFHVENDGQGEDGTCGGAGNDPGASTEQEPEFTVRFVAADFSGGESVDFRVTVEAGSLLTEIGSGTYTRIATATIVVASNDMTATDPATFSEVADINAPGEAAALASLVFGETGGISAVGSLVVTSDPVVFSEVLGIGAIGSLVVTDDNAEFGEAANISAPGILSVADDTAEFSEATVDLQSGTLNDLTATDPTTFSETPNIDAIGSLVVTDDNAAFTAAANLDAPGTLIVTSDSLAFAEATAVLSAGGALVVTGGSLLYTSAADLRGLGVLRATGTLVYSEVANINAPGALIVTVDQVLFEEAGADLQAGSTNDVIATSVLIFGETTDLIGLGTLTVNDPVTLTHLAALEGAGLISSTSTAITSETANLEAIAHLSALSTAIYAETGDLTAIGDLVAAASLIFGEAGVALTDGEVAAILLTRRHIAPFYN